MEGGEHAFEELTVDGERRLDPCDLACGDPPRLDLAADGSPDAGVGHGHHPADQQNFIAPSDDGTMASGNATVASIGPKDFD